VVQLCLLVLLWQIYSRRCPLQIHAGYGMSAPFPPCCFEPTILKESVGDHRHERVTMQALYLYEDTP
jgi:hypothetical protein